MPSVRHLPFYRADALKHAAQGPKRAFAQQKELRAEERDQFRARCRLARWYDHS